MRKKYEWPEVIDQLVQVNASLSVGTSERKAALKLDISKSHLHRLKRLNDLIRLDKDVLSYAHTFNVEFYCLFDAIYLDDTEKKRLIGYLLRGEIRTYRQFKEIFYNKKEES